MCNGLAPCVMLGPRNRVSMTSSTPFQSDADVDGAPLASARAAE